MISVARILKKKRSMAISKSTTEIKKFTNTQFYH